MYDFPPLYFVLVFHSMDCLFDWMFVILIVSLSDLCKKPVDGFSAGLVDESNLFEWSVTIIGPPETL